MMTRSNRIWEFQSIVDSPKLAPIHIWIKLVSMCGTLFGICSIIFLVVENDTLSCLDLLKFVFFFSASTFVLAVESLRCASISSLSHPLPFVQGFTQSADC